MSLPIWFLIVALLAEIMTAVIGFGSATVLTPLAALIFDVKTALALVAVFHISGAFVRFIRFRPAVDLVFFRRFGLPAVIAAVAGSLLVRGITVPTLMIILGIFLIILVLYELTHPKFHLPRIESLEVLSGGLTGFFGGLMGAGGALRAVSLEAFGMKKEEYIGTSALMAVLVDAARIPIYASSGYLSQIPIGWIAVLIGLGIMGSLIGMSLIEHVALKMFRIVVLGSVFVVAIKLIKDGIGW